MPTLPIRRIIMYKHGVGYFERRGPVSGASLQLTFPRVAMDDVLKSLIVLDLGAGQVRGVDFETPEDRAAQLARGSIHLSDERSLLDLLRDLRGRQVRLLTEEERGPRPSLGLGGGRNAPSEANATLASGAASERSHVEGLIIGIDLDDKDQLRAPLVSLYQPDQQRVRTFAIREIKRLEILDQRADEDLRYFLRAAQSEEDRRVATVRLSEGEHDLLVGYVAPAPAWRVSYRIIAETTDDRRPTTDVAAQFSILLQGWGVFDNQLDEDLQDVTLTLVAGMPISFRYRLYEPHTPERPMVEDEERTVAAPIAFAGGAASAPRAKMQRSAAPMAASPAPEAAYASMISMDTAQSSVLPVSAGEDRGALFQYQVSQPVSVARGQSAMVPIVAQRLDGRKELLYNGQKLPQHPVVSLRMQNSTGLTLERGPVTVIEDGDYSGEAVLPFTRTGAELIVPYAVELGVSVVEEATSTTQMGGISIHDTYLLIQEWDVQQIRYRINSTLDQPADVLVERALLVGYELTETSAPIEQVQNVARWSVTCAAHSETTFAVQQRQETQRYEQIRGFSHDQLREFLRDKFLDQATFKQLEDVLAIYDQIDAFNQRRQQIAQERQQIAQQQTQIQGVLGPLGREGDEGALRTRYVARLGELDDQLTVLNTEERTIIAEIKRLEAAANQAIQALGSAM